MASYCLTFLDAAGRGPYATFSIISTSCCSEDRAGSDMGVLVTYRPRPNFVVSDFLYLWQKQPQRNPAAKNTTTAMIIEMIKADVVPRLPFTALLGGSVCIISKL